MILIICTKNESNLNNRYGDMVPDGRNGRTHGRRQNYIPPTSSGDNMVLILHGSQHKKLFSRICYQVRLKLVYSVTETSWNIEIWLEVK